MGVFLVASYPDGKNVRAEDFTLKLSISESDGVSCVADRGTWVSALVTFADLRLSDFQSAEKRSAAFSEALQGRLAAAAKWLGERRETLRQMARDGLGMFLLLDAFIDQDQFEIDLPPALLLACGECDVKIKVLTND
jgi:hypothetical protein